MKKISNIVLKLIMMGVTSYFILVDLKILFTEFSNLSLYNQIVYPIEIVVLTLLNYLIYEFYKR